VNEVPSGYPAIGIFRLPQIACAVLGISGRYEFG
jgi:hypothetical protein